RLPVLRLGAVERFDIRRIQWRVRAAITWRRTCSIDTPPAYWSYLRRYPDGPHATDAHRRLAYLAAAFEPPPTFAMVDYDVPPPPPEEIVYIRALEFPPAPLRRGVLAQDRHPFRRRSSSLRSQRLRFFLFRHFRGRTYEVGWIRNVKPYCSNMALAVIERR